MTPKRPNPRSPVSAPAPAPSHKHDALTLVFQAHKEMRSDTGRVASKPLRLGHIALVPQSASIYPNFGCVSAPSREHLL